MAKRYTARYNAVSFDTYLTIRDANDDEKEIDITVEADYTPGCPAVMYLRNGDPGYPAEGPECEITQIVGPNGLIEFESLPDTDQDRLRGEAIVKAEQYEPEE